MFLFAVTQCMIKATSESPGLFGFPVWGCSPSRQEVQATSVWSRWPYWVHSQEAESNESQHSVHSSGCESSPWISATHICGGSSHFSLHNIENPSQIHPEKSLQSDSRSHLVDNLHKPSLISIGLVTHPLLEICRWEEGALEPRENRDNQIPRISSSPRHKGCSYQKCARTFTRPKDNRGCTAKPCDLE